MPSDNRQPQVLVTEMLTSCVSDLQARFVFHPTSPCLSLLPHCAAVNYDTMRHVDIVGSQNFLNSSNTTSWRLMRRASNNYDKRHVDGKCHGVRLGVLCVFYVHVSLILAVGYVSLHVSVAFPSCLSEDMRHQS